MKPISDGALDVLHAKGRRGSRARFQRGWVELSGVRVKKWKGHYYTYEVGKDGLESRVHRAVIVGLKSEIGKKEAEKRLQEIVDREANQRAAAPSRDVTLKWFVRERCMPMWKENWKTSHAKRTEYLIEHYVVAPFADEPIASIDRFRIQVYVNDLARRASSSVVQKFVTWTRAIFEEAVEQDFLSKNPARKLVTPKETRAPARRYLTVEEVAALLGSLDGRDRLILKMYVVLGLRARELFALRRDDVDGCRIRIDETLDYANRFHRPKTVSSAAWLWLPAGLGRDLAEWMDGMTDRQPGALLFAASNGSPIRSENWRKRVLQAAAADVGLVGVTIHALRRTCATWLNTQGKLKDVQAHLRHARPEITAEIYVQEIPESVREAVAKLELRLSEQS